MRAIQAAVACAGMLWLGLWAVSCSATSASATLAPRWTSEGLLPPDHALLTSAGGDELLALVAHGRGKDGDAATRAAHQAARSWMAQATGVPQEDCAGLATVELARWERPARPGTAEECTLCLAFRKDEIAELLGLRARACLDAGEEAIARARGELSALAFPIDLGPLQAALADSDALRASSAHLRCPLPAALETEARAQQEALRAMAAELGDRLEEDGSPAALEAALALYRADFGALPDRGERLQAVLLRLPCETCSGARGCAACAGARGTQQACAACGGALVIAEPCTLCARTGRAACEGCRGSGSVLRSCLACAGDPLPCAGCSGRGSLGGDPCLVCAGAGERACVPCAGSGRRGDGSCRSCGGAGRDRCLACAGRAVTPRRECGRCEGSGKEPCAACDGSRVEREPCLSCSGSGRGSPCGRCRGSGELTRECEACAGGFQWRSCASCGGSGECGTCDGAGHRAGAEGTRAGARGLGESASALGPR